MAQFEYKLVQESATKGAWVPKSRFEEIQANFDALGAEGWEAVGMSYHPGLVTALFKRARKAT